jgi:hypothetical protein
MYQERNANNGEVAADRHGRQCFPDDSEVSDHPRGKPLRLEWMGPRAFESRYDVQPGVDRDFWMWWGPRHDQRICHHRATADSPTDLVYVHDVTWDEYAVMATDVPAAAIAAILNGAKATDTHLTAEAFAGRLADHLSAPTPDSEPTSEVAAGSSHDARRPRKR